MSLSPQPPSAAIHAVPFPNIPATMTSPPLSSTPPNGTPSAHSNAQLAQLLTASYRESEGLRKDLAATRKRLEKAERLLASYSAVAASANSPPNANGSSYTLSEATQRVIADCEARADRAEHARDESDARRRVLSEAWEELNRYLQGIEIRAADARAGFARLVAEGGGQLVFAPIPLPGNHSQSLQTPSAPSPAIMLVPPSHTRRTHRHLPSNSPALPPLPPLTNPTSSRTRPRSGSFDDPSYQPASGQPPAKRSRNEHDYDPRSNPNHTRARPLDVDIHPRSHLPSPHLTLQPPLIASRQPNSHTHSRSSSRSSQRSLSIDEMLLEASTDDPRPRGEPQSPRAVIAHHQHPHHVPSLNTQRSIVSHVSSATAGPLDQPGEQRVYHTHIFAPPVTGAPMKKGKPGSTTGISNGSQALPTPPITANNVVPSTPTISLPQSAASPMPTPIPHHAPHPATNAQGQRICRQCGLTGRYKDGKCVEKWGPGPEGPGTVCDRCRKKMKRVERRGTMESLNQSHAQANQHTNQNVAGNLAHTHSMPARITRTDTIPVNIGIGPGGTQLIGHSTQLQPFITKRDRDRLDRVERVQTSTLAPSPSHAPRSSESQREPPSPPAIATLQTDDDDSRRGTSDRGRRPVSSAAPSIMKHLPSPTHSHSHSNSRRGSAESSADAEGDPDGDADGDADAELLEAVHAAENRSSSLKAEDGDNDD